VIKGAVANAKANNTKETINCTFNPVRKIPEALNLLEDTNF